MRAGPAAGPSSRGGRRTGGSRRARGRSGPASSACGSRRSRSTTPGIARAPRAGSTVSARPSGGHTPTALRRPPPLPRSPPPPSDPGSSPRPPVWAGPVPVSRKIRRRAGKPLRPAGPIRVAPRDWSEWTRARSAQAALHGPGGGGRARGQVEAGEDVGDVPLHGELADEELLADLPVRKATRQEAQ